jgi:hypothetical protein
MVVKNRKRFQNGTCYLAGKTITNNDLQTVLKQGTQTQRHSASLTLAVKNPEQTIVDVTGFHL